MTARQVEVAAGSVEVINFNNVTEVSWDLSSAGEDMGYRFMRTKTWESIQIITSTDVAVMPNFNIASFHCVEAYSDAEPVSARRMLSLNKHFGYSLVLSNNGEDNAWVSGKAPFERSDGHRERSISVVLRQRP